MTAFSGPPPAASRQGDPPPGYTHIANTDGNWCDYLAVLPHEAPGLRPDPDKTPFLTVRTEAWLTVLLRREHLRVRQLEAAIRWHHRQRGYMRCWENDTELYAALSLEPVDRSLPPIEEHRLACDIYRSELYNVPLEDEPLYRLHASRGKLVLLGMALLGLVVALVAQFFSR